MRNIDRTRPELAEFLRARRERLLPEDAGLPTSKRRRTPGLRREEVAALAGVGLTWYTWLEQGREIGVSADFLDNLARVLKLDAAERRHLYLLAHERPPAEPGKTFCTVPSLAARLVEDLAPHAAYIINLRWDVLAFNAPADSLFGLGRHDPGRRNLLWALFTDTALRDAFVDWDNQAPAMLASFRRDFAAAREDADARGLIADLEAVSPEFKGWWRNQDVHAPAPARSSWQERPSRSSTPRSPWTVGSISGSWSMRGRCQRHTHNERRLSLVYGCQRPIGRRPESG